MANPLERITYVDPEAALPADDGPLMNTDDGPLRITVRPLPNRPLEPFNVGELPATQPGPSFEERFAGPLLGLGGKERFQTWPERLVRSAVSAPLEAYQGKLGNEETVMEPNALSRLLGADPEKRWSVPSSGSMIGRAQDISGAAITGPLTMRPGAATLGSGATRPVIGDAAMKSAEPAPVFYSAVEHAVKGAKQNTASPDQWIGYIRNQPGVKQEELSWMGLEDWLKEQKGPVSKKQIDDYVASHKVELKEVNKSGRELNEELIGDRAQEIMDRDHPDLTPEHAEYYGHYDDAMSQADHELRGGVGGGGEHPKYSEYQLPGGENYRELLLTLPPQRSAFHEALAQFPEVIRNALTPEDIATAARFNPQFRETIKGKSSDEVFGAIRDIAQGRPTGGNYQSSHWDEPNVLAHVRVNDRFIGGKEWLPAGSVGGPKKTMFLEEVQSDWHQAGRKKGYKGKYKEGYEIKPNDHGSYDIWERGIKTQDEPIMADLPKGRAEEWLDHQAKLNEAEAIPDAPFKTTWPDLVLKRMIREAAEKGYDQIAWTPGEVQAARYDLSKHVDNIQVKPMAGDVRSVAIVARSGVHASGTVDANGNIASGYDAFRDAVGKPLADYVGKDVADKIMSAKGEAKLEGLDLKVGGEGMKSFYDKMLVDKANALAKKHGGKVDKQAAGQYDIQPAGIGRLVPISDAIRLAKEVYGKEFSELTPQQTQKLQNDAVQVIDKGDKNQGFFVNREAAQKWIDQHDKVWVLPITPKMRDAAVGKGFPLFSSGVPFVPVDHDPFRKQPRLEPVDHDPFAVLPYDPNRT